MNFLKDISANTKLWKWLGLKINVLPQAQRDIYEDDHAVHKSETK